MQNVARTPIDKFGEFLSALRGRRNISARALSLRLGFAEAYIHRWEHQSSRVNRSVLERVARELDVSDADRRELFRLADMRDAPPSAKALYRSAADATTNIVSALLEVEDHEVPAGPDSPPMPSTLTFEFAGAVAGVLAVTSAHAGDSELDFRRLHWPTVAYTSGVLDCKAQRSKDSAYAISEDSAAIVELVSGAVQRQSDPLSLTVAYQTIASAYTDWLFADPARATGCVSPISRWQLERGFEAGVLTLWFRDNRVNDRYRVDGVSAGVVADVNLRRLAYIVAQLSGSERGRNEFVFIPQGFDNSAIICGSEFGDKFLEHMSANRLGKAVLRNHLQNFRDTMYVLMDADAWLSRNGLGSHQWLVRAAHGRSKEITVGLDNHRLDTLDRLRSAVRRVNQALKNPDVPEVPQSGMPRSVSFSSEFYADGEELEVVDRGEWQTAKPERGRKPLKRKAARSTKTKAKKPGRSRSPKKRRKR